MKKRILYILLAIAVVAQFFQPDRSVPAVDPANDMLVMTQAPEDIQNAGARVLATTATATSRPIRGTAMSHL
jgi:hypothetical protein